MQRPGEMGLGGETLLRLEVVEALLEEGAGGGGCSLVGMTGTVEGKEETGLPGFSVFFRPQMVLGEFEVEDGFPVGSFGRRLVVRRALRDYVAG